MFPRGGLASKSKPRVGDLIIWNNGSHMGVYVGDGMAISALVTGVSRHRINVINLPLTAYLHTRL